MKKKNIAIGIVASIISLIGNAQDLAPTLLWKIEGNNFKTSYVYGTMHAVCDNSLNEATQKAIRDSKQIVLEVDMDDPTMQMRMLKSMRLPEGKTITALLNDTDKPIVEKFVLEQTGMQLAAIDTFNPFIIQSMMIPKTLNCPMKMIETSFMDFAKKQNKEILGLETIESQMDAFNTIPLEEQIADLVSNAKAGIAEQQQQMKILQEAYATHDLIKIMDSFNDSPGSFKNHSKAMLDDRNIAWISKIKNYSADTESIYAVGAAHLPGENGVLTLLKNEGFTVTPILK